MEPTVDYEELERLAAAATPEPWGAYGGWGPRAGDGLMHAEYIGTQAGCPEDRRVIHARCGCTVQDRDLIGRREDFEFVVRARSAVPSLLRERKRYALALEIATEALECRAITPGYECDERSRCVPCAAREAVRKLMEEG